MYLHAYDLVKIVASSYKAMQQALYSSGGTTAACLYGGSPRSSFVVIPRPVLSVAPVLANQPEATAEVHRRHRRGCRKPVAVCAVPPATQQGASTVNAFQEEQKPLTNHQLTALQSVHSAQDLQGVSQALATFNSTGSHERGADLAHPELSIAIEARLSEQVLQSAPPSVLASLFTQAAQAGVMFTDNWKAAALRIADTAMQRLSTSSASEARVLTQLLWGVSELGCDPQESWLQAAAYKVSACAQEASLLACDLSTCLAALGAMGYKPDPTWASAMVEEVSYQLAEFQSDLEAGDVARLVSGLADLKLGSQLSAEGNRLLMKAVYGKVRTIEDKAAVDFALAKLNAEERSMHYDPRWTHEELRWLPRRERDKRRIMSEGWYRTQWGGWAPGGGGR